MPDITLNGMKIHYITEGTGPDVLCLHGWGASLDSWKGVISALSEKCRITAIDFPGCGQSSLPKNPLTTDDYADLTEQLIRQLKLENPLLIGHSHGGRVIMKLCGEGRLHPQKIVLIDSAGIKPRKNIKKEFKVKTYKTIKTILSCPLWEKRTASLINKARNYFGSDDYNNAPEVMKKTLVNLVNDDMSPIIENIQASTLLIWGENDTATPLYMAEYIKSKISDCGLCKIKDAGHWSFVEKPIEANAILKSFLP